jgi:hypothetical protein
MGEQCATRECCWAARFYVLLGIALDRVLQLLRAGCSNGPLGQIDKSKRNMFIIYSEAVTMHFISIQFDPIGYFV